MVTNHLKNTCIQLLVGAGVAVCLVIAATGCGSNTDESSLKEGWNRINSPVRFGNVQSKRFDLIPRSAALPVDRTPWSGPSWSTQKGGISHRWQTDKWSGHSSTYRYQLPSQSWLRSMQSFELNALSPTEKYDILTGRYDLPLTRYIRNKMNGSYSYRYGDIPSWYGICHGWAVASYMEKRPGAQTTVRLNDGRSLTFYASDLQALMSQIYAESSQVKVPAKFLGSRCDEAYPSQYGGRVSSSRCRDTNAGAFHLVLTEYIAHRKKSLVVEVDTGSQVWNKPAISYAFRYQNFRHRNAQWDARRNVRAPGTVYLVDVQMVMRTADHSSPHYNPLSANPRKEYYQYTLELDANRYIIGGEWTSQRRPDFLWELTKPINSMRHPLLDYNVISTLVNRSQNSSYVRYRPQLPYWQ